MVKRQRVRSQLEGPSCHRDDVSQSPLIRNTLTLLHKFMSTQSRPCGTPPLSRAAVGGCVSSPAASTSLCSNNQLFFWLCFSSGEVIRFLEERRGRFERPPPTSNSPQQQVWGPALIKWSLSVRVKAFVWNSEENLHKSRWPTDSSPSGLNIFLNTTWGDDSFLWKRLFLHKIIELKNENNFVSKQLLCSAAWKESVIWQFFFRQLLQVSLKTLSFQEGGMGVGGQS